MRLFIELPLAPITKVARDHLFIYLDGLPRVRRGGGREQLAIVVDVVKEEKKGSVGEALMRRVANAIETINWLGVSVTINGADPTQESKDARLEAVTPKTALKFLSLYLIALVQSDYTNKAPRPLASLGEAIFSSAKSSEALMGLYAAVRVLAITTLKASVAVDPERLVNFESPAVGLVECPTTSARPSSRPDMAQKSDGVVARDRLIVLQASEYLLDMNKLELFLRGKSFHRGFYVRPGDGFESRLRSSYNQRKKRGHVELSFFVEGGIAFADLLFALKQSGAVKERLLTEVETGYHDTALGRHAIRVSEWLKRSAGRWQKSYDSGEVQRFARAMAEIKKAL